jgi:MFS family permease
MAAPVEDAGQNPKPVPVDTTEKVHDSETSSSTQADGAAPPEPEKPVRHTHWTAENQTVELEPSVTQDKEELLEEHCYDQLGYGFPTWKKWMILSVIFIVQVSMNFNTSLYSNALGGISEEFHVSEQAARCGAMIFLILYGKCLEICSIKTLNSYVFLAFGCELWAPWSEELGRKPILQASLFLVNVWQLPVALAQNFTTIMVGRALGGLSSAGGSVTLGMIADMWEADNQQYAVAFVVFSSVGGSVLGPIIGGFCQQYLHWRWCIWIQLIFGGFVQVLHFFLVPETRSTIMIDNLAKKMRKSGQNPNIYGPNEITPFRVRFSAKEIGITLIRPFRMFLTEPIVLTLSLLSGFSDALIFMFIQSFSPIYEQWGFDDVTQGLTFIPILVGYLIAWFSFFPAIKRNIRERHAKPDDEVAQYESRLWWLLYTAPCLPIGLIGFAWTTQGPPLPWIASMIFVAIVGIANYSIYMATIDYMICAYGPYSASATGGNGWSRDFLAGVLTIPATPFFENIGGRYHFQYASTILCKLPLFGYSIHLPRQY